MRCGWMSSDNAMSSPYSALSAPCNSPPVILLSVPTAKQASLNDAAL